MQKNLQSLGKLSVYSGKIAYLESDTYQSATIPMLHGMSPIDMVDLICYIFGDLGYKNTRHIAESAARAAFDGRFVISLSVSAHIDNTGVTSMTYYTDQWSLVRE